MLSMRPSDSEVIDRLGGPTSVAQLVRTTPQAVTQWRKNGIPKARRQYLELLRPDAFGELHSAGGARAEEARDAA